MSAWSSVRSWLGRGDARRGEAAGPRRAAPTFRPMLEELESREAPGALLGGVAQSPLSLLGSASSSGGGRRGPTRSGRDVHRLGRGAVRNAGNEPDRPRDGRRPVQGGGKGQTPPTVAEPLFADPLAAGDFTDDSSPAGPALSAGVQKAAVTGSPASPDAPAAPPKNGVGQTNGAGSTNTATTAGTIAPTTISPNSGYDGSQPLLDLAYGLPYGTPVAMGANAVAPTRGTAGPSDFSFLEFDGQGRVLVNVHSTQTANLGGLQTDLETQLGFTTTRGDDRPEHGDRLAAHKPDPEST